MRYVAILSLFILPGLACGSTETITRLMTDQKLFKDSANNITKKIDGYIRKGDYDSADVQKKQLGAVHARLAEIQASIDSRTKEK